MVNIGPKNDKARALMYAVLIDGAFIFLGVVLWLFTDNMIWLIAGIVVGALLSVPPLLKVLKRSRERS